MHYGVGVVQTRPYKPRDKAEVESGIQLVELRIVAALRHGKFFSVEELNQAIRELRDRHQTSGPSVNAKARGHHRKRLSISQR